MRKTLYRLCTAAATGAGAAASSGSHEQPSAAGAPPPPQIDQASLENTFANFCRASNIVAPGVKLSVDPFSGRGISAIKRFAEGETVVSVPLGSTTSALGNEYLLPQEDSKEEQTKKHSGFATGTLKRANLPTMGRIKQVMMLHGVNDPYMYKQMQLALSVAVERLEDESPYRPYFDVLPHPAIDDERVMGLHRDVLNVAQKVEWQDFLSEFFLMARELREGWAQAPPVPIILWAWRTVLARQFPMPNHHLAKSHELSTLKFQEVLDLSKSKSLFGKLKARFIDGEDMDRFELTPMLLPMVDFVSHVSTANVALEFRRRQLVEGEPEQSVAELQAVTTINPGDVLGYRFSRAHEAPFALVRFGFLPT